LCGGLTENPCNCEPFEMIQDDAERQWAMAFFARSLTVLGTLPLAYGFLCLLVLPVETGNPAFIVAKCELILWPEALAGLLLLAAMAIDLKRRRRDEYPTHIENIIRGIPLLSLFPHPLRWILVLELFFWALLVLPTGGYVLRYFMR